jgi:hypothetical protein
VTDKASIERIEHADALSNHRFKYYDFAMAATCVVFVCSNIIGAGKVADFGQAPRIVFASITAFWAGELANAYVMAHMKVASGGNHLWQRTIGSTVVGQGLDSLIFYPLAFSGVWSLQLIITVMITNYFLKVLWEAMLTPVTYRVVGALKRAEGVDVYDKDTAFTPFSIKS